MEKVLLIDFLNFCHRANVVFGNKTKSHQEQILTHEKKQNIISGQSPSCICGADWSEEKDNCFDLLSPKEPLCVCGARWSKEELFCYGDRYSIVFCFFRNFRALIEQFKPNSIFFALEGKNNFRYSLYDRYKQNRLIKEASKNKEANDRFIKQRDIILSLLAYMPITFASNDEHEADDVLASLSHDLANEETIIISGDTDFIQLLQKKELPNLKLYSPVKKEYLQAPEYFYLPWKILRGDKSDNIPSIAGAKKTLKMLADPQLLSDFLAIEENRANFNRNKELIELRVLPLDQLTLETHSFDALSLKDEFIKMRLDALLNEPYWTKFQETFSSIK